MPADALRPLQRRVGVCLEPQAPAPTNLVTAIATAQMIVPDSRDHRPVSRASISTDAFQKPTSSASLCAIVKHSGWCANPAQIGRIVARRSDASTARPRSGS